MYFRSQLPKVKPKELKRIFKGWTTVVAFDRQMHLHANICPGHTNTICCISLRFPSPISILQGSKWLKMTRHTLYHRYTKLCH